MDWKPESHKNRYFNIGLEGNDGYRLYINGELLVGKWEKQTYSTMLKRYYFEKDKLYQIKIEFYEPSGGARINLIWDMDVNNNWKGQIAGAVSASQEADVAVVIVGINEGEFQDRAFLNLPGHQEEMIREISRTGKPVVVVIIGGSAVTMSHWISGVSSVIYAWYPGQEGGRAVADVLFGDYNPSGRLPVTFPISEAQLPLVYNHKPTGRGDDYNNLTGLPLFPFGYGLSYTNFEYSNLTSDKDTISDNESVRIHFNLKNTGKYAGEEVVQLYIRDELASVARPVLELKGFKRIYLSPQETKEVTFTITPELLKMYNHDMKEVIEPGEFRIMIGPSSRELKLKRTITVK